MDTLTPPTITSFAPDVVLDVVLGVVLGIVLGVVLGVVYDSLRMTHSHIHKYVCIKRRIHGELCA